MIYFEVTCGKTISYVASEMVRLANETDELVVSFFNGIQIQAKPGDYPLNIKLRYENKLLIKANVERLKREELLEEELYIWRKKFFS